MRITFNGFTNDEIHCDNSTAKQWMFVSRPSIRCNLSSPRACICIYIYIYIYIYTNIDNAKIFLPSHHAYKTTPRTSRLIPSHRASRGERGTRWRKKVSSNNEMSIYKMHCCQVLFLVLLSTTQRDKKFLQPNSFRRKRCMEDFQISR